jgi:hypothetical protein
MGEWMYRSTFFYLGTSWRWVVSFTPRPLYPRERAPGTHCIGGWVEDPRAGLDNMEKWKFLTKPGLEPRPLSRPARSQSLYRLRYRGSRPFSIYLNFTLRFEHRPSCATANWPQSRAEQSSGSLQETSPNDYLWYQTPSGPMLIFLLSF